jgi:hypothetical protein
MRPCTSFFSPTSLGCCLLRTTTDVSLVGCFLRRKDRRELESGGFLGCNVQNLTDATARVSIFFLHSRFDCTLDFGVKVPVCPPCAPLGYIIHGVAGKLDEMDRSQMGDAVPVPPWEPYRPSVQG